MAQNDKQLLIAELSHQINSPLAAIRNAIYLASCRTDDPVTQRYLELANDEITTISAILRATRVLIDEMAESQPVRLRAAA